MMNRTLSRLNDEPRSGFGCSGLSPNERASPCRNPNRRHTASSSSTSFPCTSRSRSVGRVTIIDEMPVRDPVVVEGDPADLADAARAADNGQAWPSWQFGY